MEQRGKRKRTRMSGGDSRASLRRARHPKRCRVVRPSATQCSAERSCLFAEAWGATPRRTCGCCIRQGTRLAGHLPQKVATVLVRASSQICNTFLVQTLRQRRRLRPDRVAGRDGRCSGVWLRKAVRGNFEVSPENVRPMFAASRPSRFFLRHGTDFRLPVRLTSATPSRMKARARSGDSDRPS